MDLAATPKGAPLPTAFWLLFPILAALVLVMPPLSFGDDFDHVRKAYTVAHPHFDRPFGAQLSVPDRVDANLVKVIASEKVLQHGYRRAERMEIAPVAVRNTPWAGATESVEVAGSVHLPLIYLPEAAGLFIGEQAGLSIEETLLLTRLLNGFTALLIIALALRSLPASLSLAALTILALPKTLLAFSSFALDPLVLAGAISLLAFAFKAFTTDHRPHWGDWLWVGLVLLALGGFRPPLLSLALLPGLVAWRWKQPRGAAVCVICVLLVVAWFAFAASASLQDPRCGVVVPIGQKIGRMVVHGPGLLARSIAQNYSFYYFTFIGEIGFGLAAQDAFTPLPLITYLLPLPVLVGALYATVADGIKVPPILRLTALSVAVLYGLGVFFTMGVTCTELNAQTINGIQGRYFIPALMLAGLAVSGLAKPNEALNRLLPWLVGALMVFSMAIEIWVSLTWYWAR